ncbi:D-alanyl-D-alanine carboxypeptidase [Fodinicurvata sp. EGI_FJ10296]|uniref:D-alanyl-D-alanine carboxypeptidase n=1 Tax=Fodinicurvata sp. EGI_FJ10296 TaxID=3231908 RepID=UPI003453699C
MECHKLSKTWALPLAFLAFCTPFNRFSGRLPRFAGMPLSISGLVILLAIAMAGTPANANPRYAAFVMDAATGEVLHARYADRPLYPASLTKMMTLYMAFQALDRGDLTMDQRITVSRFAASEPPSKLGIPAGGTIRVQEAIYSLVTRSANDIATAMGEALGGSEARFAQLMTQEARRLGMSNTTFRNAHGLPDTQQISTARDMALLSQALMRDFPHYFHYFSTRSWTYGGSTYRNHNHLMSSYEGMDGLKTGYIRAAGFNLAATAIRGNLRLIAVLFGGQTADRRNRAVRDLLDNSFASERGRYLVANGTTEIQRFVAPLPPMRPDGENAFAGLAGDNMPDRVLDPLPARFAHYPTPGSHPRRQVVAAAAGNADEAARPETASPAPDDRIAMLASGDDLIVDEIEQGSTDNAVEVAASSAPVSQWGIQIGAFSEEDAGQQAIERARSTTEGMLDSADGVIIRINTDNGPLFRARLVGFDQATAANACTRLMDRGSPCLTIAPNTSF